MINNEPFAWMQFVAFLLIVCTAIWVLFGFIKNLGFRSYLSRLTKIDKTVILIGVSTAFIFWVAGQLYLVDVQKSIVINEVCSDNLSITVNAKGDCFDYVELYNPADTSISLDGYMLSDDEMNLSKFCFDGVEIAAGEYLLVCLSGNDYADSDTIHAPFKLSAQGETIYLASPYKEIIDEVVVPELEHDTSYARVTDGEPYWKYSVGTPAKTNKIYDTAYQVSFSAESGFYDEAFALTLEAESDKKIYYTIDGSIPDNKSTLYTEPILIDDFSDRENIYSNIGGFSSYFTGEVDHKVDKAAVIRAIAYDEQGNKGEVAEEVYFVGFSEKAGYDDIGIISMIVDPDDFFCDEKGIYVLGDIYNEYLSEGGDPSAFMANANYQQSGKEWEREAKLTFFSPDRTMLASQYCGVRIQGNSKRAEVQKNFNIYARDRYGTDTIPGTILYDEYDVKSCVLRNSICYIPGDALPYELVRNRDIGIPNCEYYALFLNGEYWGLYVLEEKYTDVYFEEHYNVSRDNVVLFKGQTLDIGNEADNILYRELVDYVEKTDFSLDENYEQLKDKVDIQSFINFLCTEVYICNMDFSSIKNSCMWRVRDVDDDEYEDGRWRWLLYDVDYSAGFDATTGYQTNTFREEMPWCSPSVMEDVFMKSFMRSDEFRRDFVVTFMDMVNYEFNSSRIIDILNEYENLLTIPMQCSRRRFVEGTQLANDFNLLRMKSFYENRQSYILDYMEKEFSLDSEKTIVTMEMKGIDGNSYNQVQLNSLLLNESEFQWSGEYYKQYPIEIKAMPALGYKFVGWEISNNDNTTDEFIVKNELEIVLSDEVVNITAHFEKE